MDIRPWPPNVLRSVCGHIERETVQVPVYPQTAWCSTCGVYVSVWVAAAEETT